MKFEKDSTFGLKMGAKTKYPKNLINLNILWGVFVLLPFLKQKLNLSQILDSES